MAVDSAHFAAAYTRRTGPAAAGVASEDGGGGASPARRAASGRVRSVTDPERYAVYAAMRSVGPQAVTAAAAAAVQTKFGLPPNWEPGGGGALYAASAAAAAAASLCYSASPSPGDGGDLYAASFSGFSLRGMASVVATSSPEADDPFAASFGGFALRGAGAASARSEVTSAPALHRARLLPDVRGGGGASPADGRQHIYDIEEDLADVSLLCGRFGGDRHSPAAGRPRAAEHACCDDLVVTAAVAAGGCGVAASKPPIRRAASERRRHEPPAAAVDGSADNDYGFLCYSRPDAVSEIMQKDSSSSGKRFFNRKKRNSKSASRQASISGTAWCYEERGRWMNDAGVSLILHEATCSVSLSEKEYSILQKICLVRLQSMEIGCPVTIPKGDAKRKRFGLKKKRSNTINLGHLLEHLKESTKKDKDEPGQSSGWVFAIPLTRALTNDAILRRRRSSLLRELSDSGNLSSLSCHGTEPSAASSQNSLHDDSKEEQASPKVVRSSVSAAGDSAEKDRDLMPHKLAVPHFVATCFRYLEKYGMHVLGIFRVSSSKIRVKQLHDEFDSGREVKLDEEQNPHDVAALLKEYFRELPEPLLCRELYEPLLATRSINDPQRRLMALRYVISLLPIPNRDLLYSLLKFLVNVHNHSNDTYDERGNIMAGNKMDSFNLATLFGPNVLRRGKSSSDVDQSDFAEKTRDVIHVVKEMIDNCDVLFSVPVELLDDVLKTLMETDQESANYILTSKFEIDKDDCRGEISSVHSSCSNVAAASSNCHTPGESSLSKSASSPSPFLHASSSSSSPPYASRMATSAISREGSSAYDMGNYVELRSPRLTITLPHPLDVAVSAGGSEKASPTSSFYVAASLPSSPKTMYAAAGSRAAAAASQQQQLSPWQSYPVSPRTSTVSGGRIGREAEHPPPPQSQQSTRYLTPTISQASTRKECGHGATSRQRPLSVQHCGDGGRDDGQETLV